ncbi:hypothetical protein EYF80_007410 [Liparis tanakae]|uniref:Uncharacterized protein n=1 Tax=Liparis tanakae TaxID=230148 RepID=A0A4Z2IWC9_9TELE|nr:hypothetical protein EYF80_007410 [Liparis tanakae]
MHVAYPRPSRMPLKCFAEAVVPAAVSSRPAESSARFCFFCSHGAKEQSNFSLYGRARGTLGCLFRPVRTLLCPASMSCWRVLEGTQRWEEEGSVSGWRGGGGAGGRGGERRADRSVVICSLCAQPASSITASPVS